MNSQNVANSIPNRRGPPVGRLWPRVTACGPALTPEFLAVNSCADQDLVIAETLLRSRMELLNLGTDGSEHLAYFCIYMADQATWLERESGSIEQIAPYELAIINSEAPLRTVSTVGTRHLSLFLPRSLVLARMAWADDICGRSLRLDSDTRSTAQSLVATLRASMALDQFDAVGPCLVQALLALLSRVGADDAPAKSKLIVTIRQEQVAECIKRHFSDPGLTVAAIAGELKVSSRYLQRVCEGGASPGEQLRQFRLRTAAERLRNASWKDRSISEVCYSCGFSSSSHFSTEFRRFYGVTPREYRA
jgi:AraC-like DNA-binding protein